MKVERLGVENGGCLSVNREAKLVGGLWRWRSVLFLCGLCLFMPCSVFAGGVTFITHGFGDYSGWLDDAADKIIERNGGGDVVAEYLLTVENSGITLTCQNGVEFGSSANTTGNAVVKINWSSFSGSIDYYYTILDYGEPTGQVADWIVSWFKGSGNSERTRRLLGSPIHLIGHSRGGSLIAAISEKLGSYGYWVDHVTFLDPHPIAGNPALSGDSDWGQYPDEMNVPGNVIFADNYYRDDGLDEEPDGEVVVGAYNLELSESYLNGLGYTTVIPKEHSDVHAWYRGTIPIAEPPYTIETEAGFDVTSDWYVADIYKDGVARSRDSIGYAFSLAANNGDNRPTDGLHSGINGNGQIRSFDPGVSDPIDNVGYLSLRSTNITAGDTVVADYRYQSWSNDFGVAFYLDTNRNPYDGFDSFLLERNLGVSDGMAGQNDPISLTIPSDHTSGSYYVFIKSIGPSEPRYFYAPMKLTVVSPSSPPGSETVSCSASSDTYVAESNPSLNFGSSDLIRVTTAANDNYGMLKFNIDDIPSGSQVDSAELMLYCSYHDGSQLYITEIDSSWLESSVTWNSKPPIQASEYTFWHDVYGIGSQSIKDTDLTNLVQAWINGTQNNYGIYLYGGNPEDNLTFRSSEYSSSSERPALVVTYTPPTPPDLIITDVHPDISPSSGQYTVGQSIDWYVTVKNNHGGPAESSNVGYYLGTSSTDLSNLINNDATSALELSESEEDHDSYTFTQSDIGKRYLICKADYRDDIDESNEDNNVYVYGSFDVVAAAATYSGGSGISSDPYKLSTPQDLLSLHETSSHYDKSFIMLNDIDLTGQVFSTALISPDVPDDETPNGFDGVAFTGNFNGNGYRILNLKIVADNTYNDRLGMFGYIDEGGSVIDIGLENCQIEGSNWWVNIAGCLAGRNNGSIEGCYAEGTITGNARYCDNFGGLVGLNYGSIEESYSQISIEGESVYVGTGWGGLVSVNKGTIARCYAEGSIYSSSGHPVGGLAYSNTGVVLDCYSITNVSASEGVSNEVAGLVSSNNGTIQRCYSAGSVTGGSESFALVGENFNDGIVKYCFWDINIGGEQGIEEAYGQVAYVSGLSTEEMKVKSNFTDATWDFDEVWYIDEGNDYPRLLDTEERLPAPMNVIASEDDLTKVAVTWQSVTGASFYKVYRSLAEDENKTALSDWIDQLTFDDSTANPGVLYYYWIKAAISTSGLGSSEYSTYDAGYRVPLYQLVATVATGHGTISPVNGDYSGGETVTLIASPNTGYQVKSWTGTDDDSSTSTTNTVTMDSDKTVTVEFEPIPYTLTASVVGGHGSIAPENDTYDYGQTATLTATPDTGYRVKSWVGTDDDASTSNTNTITMDTDKTVTVEFELSPPQGQSLSIALTDSIDPVSVGDQVTYTVTYGNIGQTDATGAVITEVLPEGLNFVSASGGGTYSGGTITWSIGTLAGETSGQTVTFTVQVKDSLADGGTITHRQLIINCNEAAFALAPSETTTVNDTQAPQLGSLQPVAGAEWVSCEPLIRLSLTDGGSGVDANAVTISIEDCVIYTGPDVSYDTTAVDQVVKGICKRSGTEAETCFSFTPSTAFDYEQQVDVVVTASDESSNSESYSYHFTTELRSFGANAKVNSDSGTLDQDHPSTVVDSSGNIWVVWDQESGVVGDSDIYIGKLSNDSDSFGNSTVVYSGANSQSHPVLGIDSSDTLYVAWQQDDPNGFWDVYISSSANGVAWSSPILVSFGDPDNQSNQMYPDFAIDHDTTDVLYVVCEDDRAGNQDIWVASSTDGVTWTPTQITTDASDQTEPAITINHHVAVVGWTDTRNATSDLYGAASEYSWALEAVVTTESEQSSLAFAVDSSTEEVHEFWVDDAGGYNSIYYDRDAGVSIVDEPDAVQTQPSAAVSVTSSSKVFAAWSDSRNVASNEDTDIYFAEKGSSFGTNILVNDDSGTAAQSSPELGVDGDGNPYIVWVDERNGNKDIYYAGAMNLSDSLPTQIISANNRIRVEATNREHLSVEMSSDALPDGVTAADITIREVANPPEMPGATGNQVGLKYEYGPSGLVFDAPVTLRIPLEGTTTFSSYRVYRYDPNDLSSLYYPWTDEGILNPATPSSDGTYLEVQVEHFSIYGSTGLTTTPGGGGGGGKGGCALAPYPYSGDGGCSPLEFFLPFGVCVLLLIITKKQRGSTKVEKVEL